MTGRTQVIRYEVDEQNTWMIRGAVRLAALCDSLSNLSLECKGVVCLSMDWA